MPTRNCLKDDDDIFTATAPSRSQPYLGNQELKLHNLYTSSKSINVKCLIA